MCLKEEAGEAFCRTLKMNVFLLKKSVPTESSTVTILFHEFGGNSGERWGEEGTVRVGGRGGKR